MHQWTQVLTEESEVRAILGEPTESQRTKCIDHIDRHCRAWIERCPFVVICSADASGTMDVSPKGDPPGFVRVLDDRTLIIPDRRGNRRADTFFNVLQNANVALIFLMPRRGETLRVSGTARIVRDDALLSSMAMREKKPDLALEVTVSRAMFHCGKSMVRSKLWNPEHWPPIEGLPSYAQALADQSVTTETIEEMDKKHSSFEERGTLY
jgi:PPOX class probable FMN-dependent enzyme